MKDMKKLLSIILATSMVCALSVNASAADYVPGAETNITGDTIISNNNVTSDNIADRKAGQDSNSFSSAAKNDIAVQANISAGAVKHVIAVSVDKTTLTYSYTLASKVWDPVLLKYVDSEAGSATWTDQTITVTNYSDVGVSIKATYDNTAGDTTVTGRFKEGETQTIASAYNESSGSKASTATYTLQLNGQPHTVSANPTYSLGTISMVVTKQ